MLYNRYAIYVIYNVKDNTTADINSERSWEKGHDRKEKRNTKKMDEAETRSKKDENSNRKTTNEGERPNLYVISRVNYAIKLCTSTFDVINLCLSDTT